LNFGLIDGAGKLILCPVVVDVRIGEVFLVELLEGQHIEIIAVLNVNGTPVGRLEHAI